MFVLCKFKDHPQEFILFSKTPFVLDEGLEKIKDLTFNHETFSFEENDYDNYPILNYLDFMIRTFNNKSRTITHVLSESNIESVNDIFKEYSLILDKKSKLSSSKRKQVLLQHDRLTDEEDNTVPVIPASTNTESTGE